MKLNNIVPWRAVSRYASYKLKSVDKTIQQDFTRIKAFEEIASELRDGQQYILTAHTTFVKGHSLFDNGNLHTKLTLWELNKVIQCTLHKEEFYRGMAYGALFIAILTPIVGGIIWLLV